jgi:hypothetical protein
MRQNFFWSVADLRLLSLIMFAVILAVLYIMFPPQKILRY